MPSFQYRAKDGPERLVEGTIDAVSEPAAIEKISQLGLVPIHVRPAGSSPASSRKEKGEPLVLSTKRLRTRQTMSFSRHLASLLKSGVPILKAIWVLNDQEKDPSFKKALNVVSDRIKEGKTLSEAIESSPEFFSPMYSAIIRAGESGGGLQEALARMAEYLKKQDSLTSKIRRAMAYPMLLGVAGLGTVFFVITFVVPKLAKIFADLHQELPLATRIVMSAGQFMQHYWIFVLVGLFLLVIGIPAFLRKYFGADFFDSIALSTPFMRKFAFKRDFSAFSRTLEMAISHGLPFLEALRVSIPVVKNRIIAADLAECRERVTKGDSFGASLKQYPYFPHFVTNLISIGEESGRLQEVLNELSDTYEQEIDDSFAVFTTLLEPAMILLVGSLVGFIVIAMLLPIFEMNAVM